MRVFKCNCEREYQFYGTNVCPQGGCLLIAESKPLLCVNVPAEAAEYAKWKEIKIWEGFDCGWHPYAKSRVYSNANLKDKEGRDGMAGYIPTDLDFYGQDDAWEVQLTTFIFTEPWKKPPLDSQRVNGVLEEIPEYNSDTNDKEVEGEN